MKIYKNYAWYIQIPVSTLEILKEPQRYCLCWYISLIVIMVCRDVLPNVYNTVCCYEENSFVSVFKEGKNKTRNKCLNLISVCSWMNLDIKVVRVHWACGMLLKVTSNKISVWKVKFSNCLCFLFKLSIFWVILGWIALQYYWCKSLTVAFLLEVWRTNQSVNF